MGQVRIDLGELPWATFAIAALCLGLSLAPLAGPEPANPAGLGPAVEYYSEHAYLEPQPEVVLEIVQRSALPERRARLSQLRDESYRRWPSDEAVRNAQQQELDRLTEQGLAGASGTVVDPAAFVPAAPTLTGFFVYAFRQPHAGALVVQLLALLLLGSTLERTWRPLRTALFSGAAVLCSAGFYLAMVPAATRPLLGPSALIAAWSAASLVTFQRSGWRLEAPGLRALRSRQLPAWLLGLVGLLLGGAGAALPGLADFAYQGSVGGLLFGAGTGLVLLELSSPPRAPRLRKIEQDGRPALERAREAQAEGDTPRAFALLQGAVRASPGERDTVLAFWDVALACSRADAACPPLLSLIHELVEHDELPLAARYWMQVTRVMPGVRMEAPALVGLAPTLAKVGQKDAALEALRKLVAPRARGVTGAIAMRAAELADEFGDPELAAEAGRQALNHPDLDGAQRVAVRQLVGDAAVRAEEAQGLNFPPLPGDGLPDEEPALGDELGSAAAPRFSSVKVIEGIPEFLGENALTVRLSAERSIDVEYERVQAIAAAGVLGIGEQPVVIIDLVFNWNEPDSGPLNVVRLRGDHFDPRSLIGDGVRVVEAYRVLLRELFGATDAQALPDGNAASGGSMRVFESMDSYQRKVLEVAGD
jgi:membrane associated rhomboid family serine protease